MAMPTVLFVKIQYYTDNIGATLGHILDTRMITRLLKEKHHVTWKKEISHHAF
jgi:hypothetical protein